MSQEGHKNELNSEKAVVKEILEDSHRKIFYEDLADLGRLIRDRRTNQPSGKRIFMYSSRKLKYAWLFRLLRILIFSGFVLAILSKFLRWGIFR